MPVRSLNSRVFKWPDRRQVEAAARDWARRQAERHPELKRVGYFGSYARGDWGVGSDLDLVAVVAEVRRPFGERLRDWDLTGLPVPAELLVYTEEEWKEKLGEGGRFARVLADEVVWIYSRDRSSI